MTLSAGGRKGTNLRTPFVFLFQPNRSFSDITNKFGLGKAMGRGRVAVFIDMGLKSPAQIKANGGGPDVLFINLPGNGSSGLHFSYENIEGNCELRKPMNFERVNEERAIVTDIDNDGVMELVHFSLFRIFKLTAPFTFKHITGSVASSTRRHKRTISTVVELDFNNDGRMDLYLARAESNLITPRGPKDSGEQTDVLLMNKNGKYVDVTSSYNIPKLTNSMGVSAEDFNNDGWIDLIVMTFEGNDFMLLNNGGRKFEKVDLPKIIKPTETNGHNVMALDYNGDGHMDFIVN